MDGRARLAELARPLLQKISPGVYRELLIDRLAESVRMPAARLASLLIDESKDEPSQPLRRALSGGGASAGRGSVVRQAIAVLLNFPDAAKARGAYRTARGQRPGREWRCSWS